MDYLRNWMLAFLLVATIVRGSDVCLAPPKGIHSTAVNLDDDIVLTMVPDDPEKLLWRVVGSNDDEPNSSLEKHFKMKQDGPFWNLIVTKAIKHLPKTRKGPFFRFKLKLECTEKDTMKKYVYPVKVAIASRNLLEKIHVTVLENTPVGSIIYHENVKNRKAVYTNFPLQGSFGADASNFFHLNSAKGSVRLVEPLDYETGPKVMWLFTSKKVSRTNLVRLFRIEVGNANDNSPAFRLNKECNDEEKEVEEAGTDKACSVTHYEFTVDEDGHLKSVDDAEIYAVDLDGDALTYAIVHAVPEQNLFSIDARTGKLTSRGPIPRQPPQYTLTIQASDGLHKTAASVVIKVTPQAEQEDTGSAFTTWLIDGGGGFEDDHDEGQQQEKGTKRDGEEEAAADAFADPGGKKRKKEEEEEEEETSREGIKRGNEPLQLLPNEAEDAAVLDTKKEDPGNDEEKQKKTGKNDNDNDELDGEKKKKKKGKNALAELVSKRKGNNNNDNANVAGKEKEDIEMKKEKKNIEAEAEEEEEEKKQGDAKKRQIETGSRSNGFLRIVVDEGKDTNNVDPDSEDHNLTLTTNPESKFSSAAVENIANFLSLIENFERQMGNTELSREDTDVLNETCTLLMTLYPSTYPPLKNGALQPVEGANTTNNTNNNTNTNNNNTDNNNNNSTPSPMMSQDRLTNARNYCFDAFDHLEQWRTHHDSSSDSKDGAESKVGKIQPVGGGAGGSAFYFYHGSMNVLVTIASGLLFTLAFP